MQAFQTTLAAPAVLSGVGVHSGAPVRMTLKPAPAGAGVVFVRTDLPEATNRIPASVETVSATMLATVVANAEGASVSTVEHLMAAFAGLGIDNALVEIDGPETPIMDGSAADFADALDAAGVATLPAARRYLRVLAPIEVGGPGKRAALVPAERFEMSVEIVFGAPAIGRQQLDIALDPASFRAELADARTFGFIAEVEQLRAAGYGRGASLDNTIVVDGDHLLNPGGLRRPDEFVRHKAMDALGDLALLGAPILGRYEASCSGHALNNALARAVRGQPEAWRYVAAEALAETD
ncbi:MAG TPA: UDP-3-O-acyl-N-acetylglucosamine deacetylase [Caulobacteraceae bacterium]|nr:UDP-3-O-acyl-N-acetylglucosamine deacetylase [Caulobacteraceae bacterium]